MAHEFTLEQIAPEMEYATVTRWHKREGDTVAAGELIVELEVEKANYEVEAPVSGVVAAILAVEGDELKVGQTLAVIEEA
ncbi:MAG TPA: biotin/lipoyl-containing protein [Gaiellaceae bacterium]|nr:biotin/lipoyl-containing protein [Gaiellaceae bacterium]